MAEQHRSLEAQLVDHEAQVGHEMGPVAPRMTGSRRAPEVEVQHVVAVGERLDHRVQ